MWVSLPVLLRVGKTEITKLKEEKTYEETSKIYVAQTQIMKWMNFSFIFLLFFSVLCSFGN